VRPGPARASFGIAHLIALAIFAQAVLAGFFLNGSPALISVHNRVGSALVVLALVLLVLALASGFEAGHGLSKLAAILLAVTLLQYGLGIAGRTSPIAAALHVPLAFVAFAVAMLWMVRARRALKGSP
jgi:hypothetical protein